ncbi:MAG TPA: TerB family tellurite resistance protein [Dongiaceae bacterium]|jgi:uncharacterized tellurite resistance protein B-like protein
MAWFERIAGLLAGKDEHLPLERDGGLQLAVAALLVEAALMDDRFDAAERRTIAELLAIRFGLSADQAQSLLASAEKAVRQSTQLFRFTQSVAEKLDPAERARIVEMLWEVAYADGVLSPQEDALIRRIAGLVYVDDSARMAARQRVRRRQGLSD